jgi:hypothetical protein
MRWLFVVSAVVMVACGPSGKAGRQFKAEQKALADSAQAVYSRIMEDGRYVSHIKSLVLVQSQFNFDSALGAMNVQPEPQPAGVTLTRTERILPVPEGTFIAGPGEMVLLWQLAYYPTAGASPLPAVAGSVWDGPRYLDRSVEMPVMFTAHKGFLNIYGPRLLQRSIPNWSYTVYGGNKLAAVAVRVADTPDYFEVREAHFAIDTADSTSVGRRACFTCLSRYDRSTGFRLSEADVHGSKERDYNAIWPVQTLIR